MTSQKELEEFVNKRIEYYTQYDKQIAITQLLSLNGVKRNTLKDMSGYASYVCRAIHCEPESIWDTFCRMNIDVMSEMKSLPNFSGFALIAYIILNGNPSISMKAMELYIRLSRNISEN